jgi:hypothetical protein
MAHTLVVIGREFHTVLNDEVKRCVQSLKSQGIAIQTVAKTKSVSCITSTANGLIGLPA